MKDFIVKTNIWFGGKLYDQLEVKPFNESDPEVKKLIEKGFIELTEVESLVPTEKWTVEKIKNWLTENQVEFKPNSSKKDLLSLCEEFEKSTVENLVKVLQDAKQDASPEESKSVLFNKFNSLEK